MINDGNFLEYVAKCGIFDGDFYSRYYPDSPKNCDEALAHFINVGVSEARKPNFYFDYEWYLAKNSVNIPVNHALAHYLMQGDALNLNPSKFFDVNYYRNNYSIEKTDCTLSHYIKNSRIYIYSPHPEFDILYYAENNKDVSNAGVDAFEHFVLSGYKEGREPSENFRVKYYIKKYLNGSKDINPFIHYLDHKGDGIHFGTPRASEFSVFRDVKRYSQPNADFETTKIIEFPGTLQATVLAFYLPQFHPIAENNEWWGEGFTEWTNIARGLPRFAGHYQPRVPRDLGFYNLTDQSVVKKQIELAKIAGLSGFVYYYYWFNGRRLLEKPLEALIADPTADFPFCLMWANENWTRRWDGEDTNVLMAQDYTNGDDAQLVADFVRHFDDSRYIRIQNRPLLMIYRADVIPDIRETLKRWRALFRKNHNENPIIITAQAFNNDDPREFGADGAIEFPPHKLTSRLPSVHADLDYLDDEFSGKVYQYDDVVDVSLADMDPPFPLIKTAVPSWDNDARRQGTGLVLTGSTPLKYEKWLGQLVENARAKPFFGTPLVCINAWNEWCEGAYLEPDQHFGSAYLNATARAIYGLGVPTSSILLIGHDAFPSGAQMLLLNIGRTLIRKFGVKVEFLLLAPGALEKSYREVATTHVCTGENSYRDFLHLNFTSRFGACITNTLASAWIVPDLAKNGLDVTLLIHEMPSIIRKMQLADHATQAINTAKNVIFSAPAVCDLVLQELQIARPENVQILPQGCYQAIRRDERAGVGIRNELRIAKGASLVVGIGYADLRKGFDLFLQLWRSISQSHPQVHMAWLGGIDPDLKNWFSVELNDAIATGRFHMLGFRDDVQDWLNAADIYALTSREDPFPSVVLEALCAGLPVYAFDNSGGIPQFLLKNRFGVVVPHADVQAMAGAMRLRLGQRQSAEDRQALADRAAGILSWSHYVDRLMELAYPTLPKISVAVPNYNYGRYLEQRLGSIFRQSHPVQEVIVLDDCSTDDSLETISSVATSFDRTITLLPNERNSGSVFAQWRKAAEVAKSEYLWIAEADDDSQPDFLAESVAMMEKDAAIAFTFCDSSSIDSSGEKVWDDYKGYYATVEPNALRENQIFEGRDFIERFLSVKNLILNASSVLWRRDALIAALEACRSDLLQYKMAGDWRIYVEALSADAIKVGYVEKPLNIHRRHGGSVTHTLDPIVHISEISRCHAVVNSILGKDGNIDLDQKDYLKTLLVDN